jgi:hypothetical protein
MAMITAVALLLGGVLLAIGLFLGGRYLVGVLRRSRRGWVERSGVDRRRRKLPVTFERRVGPRRQEDIARLFLAGIGA